MLFILEVAGQAASEVKMRATKTKACLYINIYYGVKKNSAYDIITVNRVMSIIGKPRTFTTMDRKTSRPQLIL